MKYSNFLRLLLSCLGFIMINMTKAQYIRVDKSLTAQQLVEKFIGVHNSSCISISNVSVKGNDFGGTDLSYGYFDKNGSSFDIDEGIILSTGKVSLAPGPNDNLQSEFVSGWGGDPDLFDALDAAGSDTRNLRNATYLEFDFESLQSDKISFDYMFLSEEYRKTNCRYSDAFAFLIKKADGSEPYRNIAVVPGTNTPVTSLSINNADDCPRNVDYFGTFNEESALSQSPTNFNGQTKILKAITTVEIGVKYRIKLVIADHGDASGLYDSAVFLKAGSFTGNVNIGSDLTIENSDPLCENIPFVIKPTPEITDSGAIYTWFKDGKPLLDSFGLPVTTDHYEVKNEEGVFLLQIKLSSGCFLEGNITIEKAPLAQVSSSPIMICDDDFDGIYKEKLSKFDNQLIQDYDSGIYQRSYSLTPGGTSINPNVDFQFTQNPQTLYLSVGAFSCSPNVEQKVQFYFGRKMNVDSSVIIQDICDSDITGSQDFDLTKYLSLITTESDYKPTYFLTEEDAISGNNALSNTIREMSQGGDRSYFIRIDDNSGKSCFNYKEITFRFKQPRKSTSLPESPIIICKGGKVDLDAGLGFQYYKWSNGVEGEFANEITDVRASENEYWVDLTYNDCVYRQFVKIEEAEEPAINDVVIRSSTATIIVSGGTKPYSYAVDKSVYQSSPVFENLELGIHRVYVQGADGCSVVTKDFAMLNVQNAITPNNDGINDIINYSSLLQKQEPKFEIYDRFGVQVFKGDVNNQFIWNGTSNGRPLPTSSYWYILEWNETGNLQRTQLSGWILLKNRN